MSANPSLGLFCKYTITTDIVIYHLNLPKQNMYFYCLASHTSQNELNNSKHTETSTNQWQQYYRIKTNLVDIFILSLVNKTENL